MEDEWVSAIDAFKRVGQVNPSQAAGVICGRAFDGLIAARARLLIVGDRRQEDADVPHGFWWARGREALTQNWMVGDFETWIDKRVHCRAYGVQFLARDIDAVSPPVRASGTKFKPPGPGNYASASRCVDELQTQLGGSRSEIADQIVRFCRAGLVQSRCDSLRYQVAIRNEEQEVEHVAIPDWFWDHCAVGPDSILDWQSGRFAGRGLVNGQTYKVLIKGAEFDIGGIVDLEKMLREQEAAESSPEIAAQSAADAPIAGRGGRPKSEKWTDWIAELVNYFYEEGVPDGSGADGQDALIGAIEERLAARDLEGPSRSTVQPAVRAALLRLRSAGN